MAWDLASFFRSLGLGQGNDQPFASTLNPKIKGTVQTHGVQGPTYPQGTQMMGTSGVPVGGIDALTVNHGLTQAQIDAANAQALRNKIQLQGTPVEIQDGSSAGPFKPIDTTPVVQDTPLPSLQDALAQAQALMKSSGWNPGYIDVNSISYDPLRNNAKQTEATNSAKLQAMYKQLTNSSKVADNKASKQSFDQAKADTKAIGNAAVNQINEAAGAASDRNAEVLKNLGLGDALVNQVKQGTDANSAAAANAATAAANSQTAQQAVAQKAQASQDYNTQMGDAYSLQGGEQVGALKQQLASLLANYDIQEQQARLSAQDKNASLAQNEQNTKMSLAQALLGNDWNQLKYNDSLAAAQAAALQSQQNAANQNAYNAQQSTQANDFLKQWVADNPNQNNASVAAAIAKQLFPQYSIPK